MTEMPDFGPFPYFASTRQLLLSRGQRILLPFILFFKKLQYIPGDVIKLLLVKFSVHWQ